MSTLPQIDPVEATGAAAEALAQTRKTLGAVPNMAKAMANSPALLKGWLALSGALSGGVIPAPVREQLALATAEYNRCESCLSAQSTSLPPRTRRYRTLVAQPAGPRRGPARHGQRSAPRGPGAGAGGHADHPRSRHGVRAGPEHAG